MSRFKDPREYRDWNDEMIRRHDPSAYYSSPLVRWLEGFRLRAIRRAVGLARGRDRLLELGCGYGFVLSTLEEKAGFDRVFGADLSRPSLHSASGRLAGRVPLAQVDAASPPFRAGIFDAICITEVLEHVPDPPGILRAAAALLAPGGVLVVTAPNEALINRLKDLLRRTGLWRLFFGPYEAAERMEDEWHLHSADRACLEGWVREAGLELQRLRGLPFRLLPTRYLAVAAPSARSGS